MSEIESQWAARRIEAAADGTLPPTERRRMDDAMAADPRLREAVERATALRVDLRKLRTQPVPPPSLLLRLLRIPQGAQRTAPRRTRRFALAGIGLAAAAIAAIAAIALFPPTPRRDATRQAHEQAVEEFGVAMAYLRQSVTVASDQSASAVRGALAADGRAAQDRSEPGNGD